ncbi:hypothetical protein MY3296_009753 [Beauveria thailandica]
MPPERQSRERAASPAGADIRNYFLPFSTRALPSVPSVPSIPSIPSVQGSAPPQKVERDDETRIVKRERIVIFIDDDDDDESESQLVNTVQESAPPRKVESDDGTRAVKRQRSVDIDDESGSQLIPMQSAADLRGHCRTSFESLIDFEEFGSNGAYRSRNRSNISNVEHVNRTLPNVKLRRIVAASVPEAESPSSNALTATAHDTFSAIHSDPNLSVKPGRNFVALYTLDDAEKICGKLADALNRWPDVNQISYLKRGKTVRQATTALLDSAIATVCPEAPIKAQAPCARVEPRNRRIAYCHICLIDPDTYEGTRVCLEVSDATADVPETRNLILNFAGSSGYEGKGDDGTFRSAVDGAKLTDPLLFQMLQRAEKYLRYMIEQSSFISRMVSNKSFRTWEESLRAPYRPKGLKQPTLYNGQQLTNHQLCGTGFQIHASRNLVNDTIGLWPHIIIRSWDVNWIARALQAGDRCFATTNDIFKAWAAMAEEADIANDQICSDFNPECLRIAVQVAIRSLEKMLRAELRRHRSWGITTESFEETAALGRVKIKKDLELQHGSAYNNAYSGGEVRFDPLKRHLKPSIDATFPYGHGHGGQSMLHTSTNIVIVPLALNYMKHIHLPITMAKISAYYRQYAKLVDEGFPDHQDPQVNSFVMKLQIDLLEECDRLTTIRINAGWKVQSRSGKSLPDDSLNYVREEWISGKFRPGQPKTQPIRRLVWGNPSARWSSKAMHRIRRIVSEIEGWAGVTLPRGQDCAYFCHESTMPPWWDWIICQQLMECRLERMKDHCNRWWKTVDTSETLYLECIFQVCMSRMVILDSDPDRELKRHLRREYSDFLYLPLGIYFHNPLTFAVAHRVHGQQMRTGWPGFFFGMTLQDRLEGESQNNILIEARTSNFLKHNFDPVYYPDLKELVKDVKMPIDIVNENIPLTPYDDGLERRMDYVKIKDNEVEDYKKVFTFFKFLEK